MQYVGKDTIMNFIVYLRSRILSNLLRSGGLSGLDMYCVLVTKEQWRRYVKLCQKSWKTQVEMGRLCPTGHTDIGNKKLEKCSTEQTGMAGASEKGLAPHRAVVPQMMMMMCLNSHYRLWWLIVGTKTVKFYKGTCVQKHIASPPQTKYHHITC